MKLNAEKAKKYLILALSAGMLIWAFALIPAVASSLPKSLAEVMTKSDSENRWADILPRYNPSDTLQNETATPGEDYEPESSAPDTIDMTGAEYVRAVNLCWYDAGDTPELYALNRTSFSVSIERYANSSLPIAIRSVSAPTVLIIHTHGTESYLPEGIGYYFSGETWRSTDASKGVVAAGKALTETLTAAGIGVIHDTTMYDEEDYNTSYTKSYRAVADALERYPTIKCVIDLHRDSIFTDDGENQKPVVTINGKDSAQVMLLIGTDEGGAEHPEWRKNLTVAAHLQQLMNERYPQLARPICLRTASFNQQLSAGSFLLEVGACGNSVDEAETAARLFGNCLAELLLQASK